MDKGYDTFFTEGLGQKYVDKFRSISVTCPLVHLQEKICYIKKENVIEQFIPSFILKRLPKKWIESCSCILEKTIYKKNEDMIEWEISPENDEYYQKLFCLKGKMYIASNDKTDSLEIRNKISFDIVRTNVYTWIPDKLVETVENIIIKKTIEELTRVYKTLEEYIESQRN